MIRYALALLILTGCSAAYEPGDPNPPQSPTDAGTDATPGAASDDAATNVCPTASDFSSPPQKQTVGSCHTPGATCVDDLSADKTGLEFSIAWECTCDGVAWECNPKAR